MIACTSNTKKIKLNILPGRIVEEASWKVTEESIPNEVTRFRKAMFTMRRDKIPNPAGPQSRVSTTMIPTKKMILRTRYITLDASVAAKPMLE
jgi:hypothetical protein